MNNDLEKRIKVLEEFIANLQSSSKIPLYVDQALTGRGFIKGGSGALPVGAGGTGATTLTGILKGNGAAAFTAISPLAGTKTYYVADLSGGTVTRKLTFVDGVLTAET